ncbi:MAG: aspartate aminotransferase family protein [Desulfobacteraceae bacterium]|nr:MAG: aspartate aminotransferase family protein [Desulfobacteraceae bacterium]
MSQSEQYSHLFTLDPARDYPCLVRGEGVYVYDEKGREYLDAIAGIGVVNIGYGRERVADAMARQAAQLSYAAPNIFNNEPTRRLAEYLARLLPGDLKSVHFTSGGSEAVEAAIKIGRQYYYERGLESKSLVISRWTSYHGATLGALSATGMQGRRKKFAPLLQEWPHIPPAYCYRCSYGKAYPGCSLLCAEELEDTINKMGADRVMAFIAEPVVGAAGAALVPPPEYWPAVRDICARHDILLIADEVITGFGRTGKPFAVNHWDVVPDMITMAKGLGGGYASLGAVGVSTRIRGVFKEKHMPFDHIFTFMSNPVSTAAAYEALQIWAEENLTDQAAQMSGYLFDQLAGLQQDHPMIGDIRGLGLMAGIELVADRSTKEPFPVERTAAKAVGRVALENGLVVYPATGVVGGVRGDIISLFPPLIFTRQHVDELVRKLDITLTQVGQILK